MADTVQDVIEKFRRWWFSEDHPEALNLLITGKTGVGKSRLVNALVGRKVAKEGEALDPCTSEVKSYLAEIEGVKVTVWDSPGLQDGTTNEARYIQDMKRKVKAVALMIYCVKMDDTRFRPEDKKAIETLTDEFGKEVWNHAVVALTFANKVEDPDGEDDLRKYESKLENWKRQFEGYFASLGLRHSIPVIPVGNKTKRANSMCLPDRENWLSDFWIGCFEAMKGSARRGMYRINKDRLKFKSAAAAPQTPAPASATAPAPAPTITRHDEDIPREIPLNEQQEKSFLGAAWDAFKSLSGAAISTAVSAAVRAGFSGGIVSGVASIGWKILSGILSLFF